jgi:hypothetical protein
MQGELKCNQVGCTEKPTHRFTWPGRDEACICEAHHAWMLNVARALDMHLQTIPLDNENPNSQDVKSE